MPEKPFGRPVQEAADRDTVDGLRRWQVFRPAHCQDKRISPVLLLLEDELTDDFLDTTLVRSE